MPDLTARITEILREHDDSQLTNYDAGRNECGCGRQGSATYDAHVAELIAAVAQEHYRPQTGITHEQRRDAVAEVIHRLIDTSDTFEEIADEVLRVTRTWYPGGDWTPGAAE